MQNNLLNSESSTVVIRNQLNMLKNGSSKYIITFQVYLHKSRIKFNVEISYGSEKLKKET